MDNDAEERTNGNVGIRDAQVRQAERVPQRVPMQAISTVEGIEPVEDEHFDGRVLPDHLAHQAEVRGRSAAPGEIYELEALHELEAQCGDDGNVAVGPPGQVQEDEVPCAEDSRL